MERQRSDPRIFFARLAFLAVAAVFVGCVPMYRDRDGFSGGRSTSSPKPSKPSKTVFQDPDDFKDAGKDAWKDEMEGLASWYGEDFHGRLTANGEVYDMYKYTAAHKTLPLGTVVRVHNLENGRNVEVRVNDRGPYVKGRVIDLSRTAARALDMRDAGTVRVRIEVKRWPE